MYTSTYSESSKYQSQGLNFFSGSCYKKEKEKEEVKICLKIHTHTQGKTMGEIFISRELFYFDWIYTFISAICSLTILGNTLPEMNKLCSISWSRQLRRGWHSKTNVPSEKGFSEDVKARFVHSCGFRFCFNPFKGMFHPCYQIDVILCFPNHIPWWIWAPIQDLKKKNLY